MESIKTLNNSKIIKSFLTIIFGTGLLAISSKIQTPFTLVPATMQTFVVLFLGIVLGYKLAATPVILYLIEGSLGFPVFAKVSNFSYLMGATGGYLVGFIFTAFFAGMIKIKNDPKCLRKEIVKNAKKHVFLKIFDFCGVLDHSPARGVHIKH